MAAYTSSQLIAMLESKFRPPGWAVLEQVTNATGLDAGGYCDAIVLGLWPSLHYQIIGIEVKVSRSDWLAEINNPKKSERFMQFCDHWYLVAAAKNIVEHGELPPTWGMLAPVNGRLKVVTPAPTLIPATISRGFLAAIARRSNEASKSNIEPEVQKRLKEHTRQLQYNYEHLEKEHEKLRHCVDAFESASGLKIHSTWDHPAEVGKAVKLVTNGFLSQDEMVRQTAFYLRELKMLRRHMLHATSIINKVKRIFKGGAHEEDDEGLNY